MLLFLLLKSLRLSVVVCKCVNSTTSRTDLSEIKTTYSQTVFCLFVCFCVCVFWFYYIFQGDHPTIKTNTLGKHDSRISKVLLYCLPKAGEDRLDDDHNAGLDTGYFGFGNGIAEYNDSDDDSGLVWIKSLDTSKLCLLSTLNDTLYVKLWRLISAQNLGVVTWRHSAFFVKRRVNLIMVLFKINKPVPSICCRISTTSPSKMFKKIRWCG